MVGAAGIEPATPTMSTWCSPAELRARSRSQGRFALPLGSISSVYTAALWFASPWVSGGQQAIDILHEITQMKRLGEDLSLGHILFGVHGHSRKTGDKQHFQANDSACGLA